MASQPDFITSAEKEEEFQRLVDNLTHDFQESAGKVIIISEFLSEKLRGLDANEKDYLSRLGEAGKRIKVLIAALNEYARYVKTPAQMALLDLPTLWRKVLADWEARIAQAGAKIEIKGAGTVRADAAQIRYVFDALLSNAFKFAKENTPLHITLESRSSEKWTEILVRDNGQGFDEKFADKIFEPFRSLHPKGKYEGAGIGLATTRRIIRNHGGKIMATSAPGNGACFMITLPHE